MALGIMPTCPRKSNENSESEVIENEDSPMSDISNDTRGDNSDEGQTHKKCLEDGCGELVEIGTGKKYCKEHGEKENIIGAICT